MKKLRIAVLLIILAFSFSVKAEASLGINCNNDTIEDDKVVTCNIKLIHEQISISDIEFDYETNLNIDFITVSKFTTDIIGNKIMIHTNKPLYDIIKSSTKIIEFTLSANDTLEDIENLIISNIKINKSDDILVNNISKTFRIKKLVQLDSVCTLENIYVDNKLINGFNKDKFEYYLNVENEIIFIDAERTSNKSSAVGLGNDRIKKSETKERDIIVTAEDGTKNVYKLFITNTSTKEENIIKENDEQIKSNDNTLKSLEIYNNDMKLDFLFDKEKEVYNFEIIDNDLIKVKAELNDNKASFVSNYGPRDIKLKRGYNQLLIKIKAENGNERVITINIEYKESLYDNNELLSLKINNEIVDLENEELKIIFPNSVTRTVIEAIPKNDNAIVNYSDIDLLVGDNIISIEVVSVSGISKTYEINIIREKAEIMLPDTISNPIKEENNSLINIICYLVFGIGIIVLILSIIYINKKKKSTI